jgi:hypothetical protein
VVSSRSFMSNFPSPRHGTCRFIFDSYSSITVQCDFLLLTVMLLAGDNPFFLSKGSL